MSAERKTILVPVDFEGASARAIEAAKWLAGALGADLVLLHVHDRPSFDHPELPTEMVSRIEGVVEKDARTKLADLTKQVGAVRSIFAHGDAATRILETAAEAKPAMIVMGTHGRKGMSRIFMGSVAAHVVRAAPVPVVTVKMEAG
jgi:nucleotide-binding universal stress UspA family protein